MRKNDFFPNNFSVVVGEQMWWKYYVFMYVNIKIIPVETIPGMRYVIVS
jgi:hypothetical protein